LCNRQVICEDLSRQAPPLSVQVQSRDAATTEFLSLSLHDALPIYDPVELERRAFEEERGREELALQCRGVEAPTLQGEFFPPALDRKSTRLNSTHVKISYAVFCLKK